MPKNNPDTKALLTVPSSWHPDKIIPLNISSSNTAGSIAETKMNTQTGTEEIVSIMSATLLGNIKDVIIAIKFATGWIRNAIKTIRKKFLTLNLFNFKVSFMFSLVAAKYRMPGKKEHITGVNIIKKVDKEATFLKCIPNIFIINGTAKGTRHRYIKRSIIKVTVCLYLYIFITSNIF
jgi:hypothetical protein